MSRDVRLLDSSRRNRASCVCSHRPDCKQYTNGDAFATVPPRLADAARPLSHSVVAADSNARHRVLNTGAQISTVSSIFYKRISLRFRVYFAFGVSENTMKYVDIVRMISSIPSLSAH
jgi:hypothetical protein